MAQADWLGPIGGHLEHRRGNDFLVGGAKIERIFGFGSKKWRKTIKTIKLKV